MKRKFAVVLCVLLMLSMMLTACGNKQTFISQLKAASGIERFEGEITVDFSVKGLDEDVSSLLSAFATIDGDTASGQLTVKITAKDANTVKEEFFLGDTKITDALVVDGVTYINYRTIMTVIAGSYGAMMLPAGKDYIKLDVNELVSNYADLETEADAKVSGYIAAVWQGIDTFSELLENAVKDVSPTVMYKEGDNYCFRLTNENITVFVNNLGAALESDFDKLLEEYITALKANADSKDLVKEIEDNKADIKSDIADTAKEFKDFKYEEDTKFDATAYTAVKGKTGARTWIFGLDLNTSQDGQEIKVDLKYEVKEVKDTQDITIDQSKVMTDEEMEEVVGGLFGGYDEDYDVYGFDYDYDFDENYDLDDVYDEWDDLGGWDIGA